MRNSFLMTHFEVIVIVISKLLKRQTNAKPRAPAFSRALHQIRELHQIHSLAHGRFRSRCL